MKIKQKIIVNKPADVVWHLIGHQFEKAHLWMDPIPHSYAFNEDQTDTGAPVQGRICHLSNNPDGAKAREEIVAFDDAKRSVTFAITSINVPAVVPLKRNQVQMTVNSLSSHQCEVIWVAQPQLKAFAYPFYPLLRLLLPFAFGKLLSGLKRYSEAQLPDRLSELRPAV